MNIPKPDGRLSVVLQNEILASPSTQPLIQQEEEASDCPLLTPSPPADHSPNLMDNSSVFDPHIDTPPALDQTLNNINSEDGLAFLNIVNSNCKSMLDEPSSRDPMVETSSNSGSSSDTNEPVCTQLFTQLNEAYTHLAPDAQALFYNQDNGGIPPLTGIQLVVPKPPKNYSFMNWNWLIIRKTFFWSFLSLFVGCIALAVGIIATMPRRCDAPVEWWQGSLFYEIFPASFQDSYKNDGIGDLPGITKRLDYLENLGVKGIRLNSIFDVRSEDYPNHYMDIRNLIDIHPLLGSVSDFETMTAAIHKRNMTLILDLPLYPYVEDFSDREKKRNATTVRTTRQKHDDPADAAVFSPLRDSMEALLSTQSINPGIEPVMPIPLDDHVVTKAIRYWLNKGVNGFYLKGLEHYVSESNFVNAVRFWKSIVGPQRILMCSEKALADAVADARNVILNRIDLVDVILGVVDGTNDIKEQVLRIIQGELFAKAGYPWVQWSTGSIGTTRLASKLPVANASVAIAMLGMMLPGTPSIFYGDEIGMLNSESKGHQDLAHLGNLVPMRWNNQNEDQTFSKPTAAPWIPISAEPAATNLTGLVPEMSRLRTETATIYVNAVLKKQEPIVNCKVRYTKDETIVIERWYPRRNTFVFVANLGNRTQIKDLSSLFYAGHVVVGPTQKLNQNIYFKEVNIPPGEAFIVKLDK